jgi:cytochrome c553
MGGEGRPAGGYPALAGQPQAYLERQLEAYADGRRADLVMTPVAKRLSSEERQRLAEHFSRRERKVAAPVRASARGRVLATVGDNALRVQACENCHGPGGSGRAPFMPYLSGLHREYLQAEMLDWRRGTRRSDPSGQMNVIARQLSVEDIAALAEHYAGTVSKESDP